MPYCNRCGSDQHFGGQCPERVPSVESPKLKVPKGTQADIHRKLGITEGEATEAGERVKRWREQNREKYNAYMRRYMRSRREDA